MWTRLGEAGAVEKLLNGQVTPARDLVRAVDAGLEREGLLGVSSLSAQHTDGVADGFVDYDGMDLLHSCTPSSSGVGELLIPGIE
jgi:hypothetical protein